jgi:uncharacterized protein YbjT (DUF2867 family)
LEAIILRLLEADPYFGSIRVLVRRLIDSTSPKTDVMVVNFEDETQVRQALAGSSAVFCAIGTTNSKVKGDKAAYRKVDHDIPVRTARLCRETACPQLLLVSSVGADAGSGNFYLKLKGQVEDENTADRIACSCCFPAFAAAGPAQGIPGRGKAGAVDHACVWHLPAIPTQAGPGQGCGLGHGEGLQKAIPGYHVLHYNEISAYAGM